MRSWILVVLAAGCYTGPRAADDVNRSWRGRARAELIDRWGEPAKRSPRGAPEVLQWSHREQHVEVPLASASLSIGPAHFDLDAVATPGEVWTSSTEVIAMLDDAGRVAEVRGPSLGWGTPRDANLHWGTLFGAHVGLGRLGNTSTPLPSGGAYIGGMLAPQLALVGAFAMSSGKDQAGGAIGLSWSIDPQWWPTADASVRAGPAAVLGWDPGFDNARFRIGANVGASYAIVRTRVFVLDLRFDATFAPSLSLGSLGIGVNLN